MKRVLVLNAGYCDEPLILKYKQLGFYVITTGTRRDFPGHRLADKYVYGDFSDREDMLRIAMEEKIDAICPCVNDVAVSTAAYVAEKLVLPGHDSYEAAEIINNKKKFKEFVNQNEWLNSPRAIGFEKKEDALVWAKNAQGFPLIVKPVDLDSGKGINRVNNIEELTHAIAHAFEKSMSGAIVIEPFITGELNGFSTFLVNRKVVAYSSDTEYCNTNPYKVDVMQAPSMYFNEVKDELINQIERMADVLKLSDGIFHLQFIFNNGKAYIIECMRRIIGNLFCFTLNDACKGFDWYY